RLARARAPRRRSPRRLAHRRPPRTPRRCHLLDRRSSRCRARARPRVTLRFRARAEPGGRAAWTPPQIGPRDGRGSRRHRVDHRAWTVDDPRASDQRRAAQARRGVWRSHAPWDNARWGPARRRASGRRSDVNAGDHTATNRGGTTTPAAIASELVAATPRLSEREQHLVLTLYRLLAAGQPVDSSVLAESARLPVEAAQAALERLPRVFTDGLQRVIGFWGLPLGPIAHPLAVHAHALHAPRDR